MNKIEPRKFLINENIDSLIYFKNLFKKSNIIKLENDLEIEPFTEWSTSFSADYWYFKYNLLKNRYIDILQSESEDIYYSFFYETKLNFINLTLFDCENYKIQFIDGNCYLDIFNLNIDFSNEHWIDLNLT